MLSVITIINYFWLLLIIWNMLLVIYLSDIQIENVNLHFINKIMIIVFITATLTLISIVTVLWMLIYHSDNRSFLQIIYIIFVIIIELLCIISVVYIYYVLRKNWKNENYLVEPKSP